MEESCANTDTFQLIEESELVPESLSTTSASNEEYISFKDAMNQIFHEFPSIQAMMAARNGAAAQDAVESITLIDCAFITQLWLQMKAKSSGTENQQAILTLEEKMTTLWNEFNK